MNAQLKMKLLEKLMGEMDDSIMSKIPGKKDENHEHGEPSVEVTKIEQEAMPISDLKEKMSEAMSEKGPDESSDMMASSDEEDDTAYNPDDSSLIRRMKEAKRAKKAG